MSNRLESTLRGASDVQLVGVSRDARRAHREIIGLRRMLGSVLLLSCKAPGNEEAELIHAAQPLATLVLSRSNADKHLISAVRAGVRGYMMIESVSPSDLIYAIKLVGSGCAAFCPQVARRLSWYFASLHDLGLDIAFPDLTAREREILGLAAMGLTNPEITRRLVISDKTVRNHMTHIFSKLGVSSRTAAIIKAREVSGG